MHRVTKLLPITALLLLSVSCSDDEEGKETAPVDASLSEAITTYADIVLASYQDSRADAQAIKTAVDAFVADPSEATHTAAKQAWLAAQESYGQTETYRFYGGPIDDEDGPEGQLNAWPLDESLIDYVSGAVNGDDPSANVGTNIINSPDLVPTITKEVIAGYNEVGAETNISTGYHAVEFLLWGQDNVLGPGGGSRSYTDYLTDGTGTNAHQDRRGDYLSAAAELIVDDLDGLIAEWQEGGAYRKFFTSEAALENSLEKILNGMGKLSSGELAGERIAVAVDLKSVEDEHSCFSDNTHRDVVTNAKGIENVYLGSYTRTDGSVVSGTSLYDLILPKDADLAESLKTAITHSVDVAEAIQPPFEEEIFSADGVQRLEAVITSLEEQGKELAEAADLFGFTFDPNDI